MTIDPIDRQKRRKIELCDRVDHEPRQMPFGQPIPQTRRQQQLLITITRDEVLRHSEMVVTTPDGAPFMQQPPCQAVVPSGWAPTAARLNGRSDRPMQQRGSSAAEDGPRRPT